ncbi:MAG: molybdenum cofactor guanylyltransferase [Phycisphaerae bacterium]
MDDTPGKLGAAILAGGRASRYGGADKAALDCGDGRTIVRRLLDELALAGLNEVVICANDRHRYEALAVPVVPDLRAGAGPLGGIEAALGHYRGRVDGVVLLPCDLPGISAREILALADAFRAGRGRVVVAQTSDFVCHPLCAVVHNGVAPEVVAALEAGELGVGRLWRKLGAVEVRFEDETAFFNVNTPEDMADWREKDRPCR